MNTNEEPLHNLAVKMLEEVGKTPYDEETIPQESLDLANKYRTSLFPWRGQFSPELIEIFLGKYSQKDTVVLDPFVGSGTVLFEASAKGLASFGAEINPSAVEMARSVLFANLSHAERKKHIQAAWEVAQATLDPFICDLFSSSETERHAPEEFQARSGSILITMLQKVTDKPLVHNILVNAIIRFMNLKPPRKATDFLLTLQEHFRVIKNLPYSERDSKVFHADARALPLPDKSVDLIITSPPYINVFNYHQNNRPAMELVGWNLLNIAKSEIGSNRKNRQNRFLTVIQYSLDMLDALHEMRRVLRQNGRAIVVVGRESTIRGVSFNNGLIVAALAVGGAGYNLEARQRRKFKNKFGEIIYEEILHLVPAWEKTVLCDSFASSVAATSLLKASKTARDEQVIQEIFDAKEKANTVSKSPLFLPAFSNNLRGCEDVISSRKGGENHENVSYSTSR